MTQRRQGGATPSRTVSPPETPSHRPAYIQSRTYNARTCLTCGVPLPKRIGKGAPMRYCEDHAPARRAYQRRYYAEHRHELIAYQREHHGYRPRIDRTCVTPGCNREYRGWVERCSACRQRDYRKRLTDFSRGNQGRGNSAPVDPREAAAPLPGAER